MEPSYSEWSGASAGTGEDYNLEAFVSVETTLADHLAEQMTLAISNPAGRMIGQYLIDMVDEAGYLTGDLDGVADKLGARRSDVELVLAVLQAFDPPGVYARNLTECLAIQLKERNRYDPAMRTMVEHLELLAKRDRSALRRLCGVNEEDLHDMIVEIRTLNTKPGLGFGSTMVQPIVPDVFVRAAPTGHGRSSSIPTLCRRCSLISVTIRRFRRRAATKKRKSTSPTACRRRPGWCAR
jgi:RNA polymerase sigma-54 factor